tara:strand:+ start:2239 stop:2991 length:753 start_codon:yes stop_codon:yes gene_type:complete
LIKSRLLKKFNYISHGFFNKNGGCSKGIYKSLNCGLGSGDDLNCVRKNIKKVSKLIGCKSKNLVLLNQIHSNRIFQINNPPLLKLKGDASFTYKKKIGLGILTADCAPIFLFDPKNKFISAIHVGWRGAFKKIINRNIDTFKKKGSEAKDIIAVIGPCISQKNYEVKSDFLKKFLKQNKKNKVFFKFKRKKTFFSLNKYIEYQLSKCGVKKIEIIKKDTYDKKNNFFSSRRAQREKFNDYGRNISVIMLK